MRLPRPVRLSISIVLLLALILGAVFGIQALLGLGKPSGEAVRVMAELQEKILPFGDGYIATNGLLLRCFGAGNKADAKWQYGPDSIQREVSVSNKLAAMWRDDNLHIISADGVVSFTGSLGSGIEVARCGMETVAAYLPDQQSISVLSGTGAKIDAISTGDADVIDLGFFSDQDLLWVLLLDKSSTQPTTHLRTHQPSKKLSTGGYSFEDQIIYDVLYNDNKLYTVGTREVSIYNIATGEMQPKKPIVYGWQLIDRAEISKTDVGMLFALSSECEAGAPESLKLVRGDGSEQLYHLPPGCIAALVGSKGVWGIAPGMIYSYPFTGKNAEYELSYTISEVGTKLTGNSVIVQVDGEMRKLTLP